MLPLTLISTTRIFQCWPEYVLKILLKGQLFLGSLLSIIKETYFRFLVSSYHLDFQAKVVRYFCSHLFQKDWTNFWKSNQCFLIVLSMGSTSVVAFTILGLSIKKRFSVRTPTSCGLVRT